MSFLVSVVALVVAIMAYKRAGRVEERLGTQPVAPAANPVQPMPAVTSQTSPAPASAPTPTPPTPVAPPIAPTATAPTRCEPSSAERLFAWLAIDWPMKIGAFLLFLGIGWLVRFVFWDAIGEIGRTMIGIIIGIGTLVFGHWRLSRFPNQGAVIEGLGAGIISFTILVARTEYDLLTPIVALVFLFLVTVFVNFSSVVTKTRSLALIGLILGSISPLLINSHENNFLGLFLYLFVISAGTLWVVRLTGWRVLTFASFLPYLFYALPYMFGEFAVLRADLWVIALLFTTLYFLANIWAIIKSPTPEKVDLLTATANAMVLVGWINHGIDSEWKSLATVAAALSFSIATMIVYRLRGVGSAVYVYAGVSGLLLGIATAFEFSGPALTIAFTLEAGILLTGTIAFFGGVQAASPLILLFGIPIALSQLNFLTYLQASEVFTRDFAALALLALTLLACGWLIRKIQSGIPPTLGSRVLSIVGALYALVIFWIALHNSPLTDDEATTLALICYTILGLGFYIMGKLRDAADHKQGGLALLIFVISHLLIVDVWTMDTLSRIITFCLIGLLLMSTTFIGKKKILLTNNQ